MSMYQAKDVIVTPTVQTSAYATGQHMGTLMTLAAPDLSSGGKRLMSLAGVCKTAVTPALDVLFFNAAPTITSVDGATLNIAATELVTKYVGYVSLAAADWKAAGTPMVACVRSLDLVIQANGSANLYALCVARGAVTFATTTAMTLMFGFHAE